VRAERVNVLEKKEESVPKIELGSTRRIGLNVIRKEPCWFIKEDRYEKFLV
jgi:hypothetical protein